MLCWVHTMKTRLAAFAAAIALFSVGILGVFSLGHMGAEGHGGCIASVVANTDCPRAEDALSFLRIHVGTIRDFSAGKAFDGVLLALNALAVLAYFAMRFSFRSLDSDVSAPEHPAPEKIFSLSETPRQAILRWFALHENSPSFA